MISRCHKAAVAHGGAFSSRAASCRHRRFRFFRGAVSLLLALILAGTPLEAADLSRSGKRSSSSLPPAARPGHVTVVPPADLLAGEPVAQAAPRRPVHRENLPPLPPPRPAGFAAAADGKTLPFGYHCDNAAAAILEPVAAVWLSPARCPEPVIVLAEFP